MVFSISKKKKNSYLKISHVTFVTAKKRDPRSRKSIFLKISWIPTPFWNSGMAPKNKRGPRRETPLIISSIGIRTDMSVSSGLYFTQNKAF